MDRFPVTANVLYEYSVTYNKGPSEKGTTLTDTIRTSKCVLLIEMSFIIKWDKKSVPCSQ